MAQSRKVTCDKLKIGNYNFNLKLAFISKEILKYSDWDSFLKSNFTRKWFSLNQVDLYTYLNL
jgi:hypothetical protein